MSLNSPDSSTLQYGAGRCLLCLCVITSSIQFTDQVSLYTVARNGEISVHCLSSSSCRVFASKYCRSRMIWNHTIITSHAVTHCSVLFAARCYSMQARPMLSCGVCQCVCVCKQYIVWKVVRWWWALWGMFALWGNFRFPTRNNSISPRIKSF